MSCAASVETNDLNCCRPKKHEASNAGITLFISCFFFNVFFFVKKHIWLVFWDDRWMFIIWLVSPTIPFHPQACWRCTLPGNLAPWHQTCRFVATEQPKNMGNHSFPRKVSRRFKKTFHIYSYFCLCAVGYVDGYGSIFLVVIILIKWSNAT